MPPGPAGAVDPPSRRFRAGASRATLTATPRTARRHPLPASDSPAPTPTPGLGSRLKRLGEPRLPLLARSRLREPSSDTTAQAAIRALATGVPLAGSPPLVLCRVLGRFKLLVAATDLTQAPHLILDGYWKWWVTRFLARNLAPGQRVADAGAGYGYFALLAAECVGPAGHVLAVEANPLLAGLLRRNLALNGMAGHSTVVQGVLGAPPGACRIEVPLDSPAAARLLPPDPPDGARSPLFGIEAAAAPPLDTLLPEGADWILLDINGAEPAAWDGMQAVLDRSPGLGIILSHDPARLPAPGAWLARLAERFPLRRIDHDGVARPIRADQVAAQGETTLCLMRGAPR